MEKASVSLARVWALVAGVLAALRALPGFASGMVPGAVAARAFAELRVAEAAARRAVFALAADHPRPVQAQPGAPPSAPDTRPVREFVAQADDYCRPFSLSDRLSFSLARTLSADGSALPADTLPERGLTGLKARMAALEDVLAEPGPALARYLRLRDRPPRHVFAPTVAPRLRPGRPPGYDPARWQDWAMDVLMEVHRLALHALNTPPPEPAARHVANLTALAQARARWRRLNRLPSPLPGCAGAR